MGRPVDGWTTGDEIGSVGATQADLGLPEDRHHTAGSVRVGPGPGPWRRTLRNGPRRPGERMGTRLSGLIENCGERKFRIFLFKTEKVVRQRDLLKSPFCILCALLSGLCPTAPAVVWQGLQLGLKGFYCHSPMMRPILSISSPCYVLINSGRQLRFASSDFQFWRTGHMALNT